MKIFFRIEGNNGCGLYRMVQPAMYLRKLGFETDWGMMIGAKELAYDIIVMQRPQEDRTLMRLQEAKRRGAKIVLEFDDNQFNIPEWNPAHLHFKGREHIVAEYARIADGITVSTPNLKEVFSKYHDKIVVLPNCIDSQGLLLKFDFNTIIGQPLDDPSYDEKTKSWSVSRKNVSAADYLRLTKGKTVISWGGSVSHLHDLRLMTDDLIRLMKDRDDFVMVWMGAMEDKMAALGIPERQFMISAVTPRQYLPLLRSLGIHIGLAPVVDVPFNHGKSNLKVIEYMTSGVIPVASDVVTYQGTFEHGIQGFYVAENNGGWYAALNQLLDSPSLREKMVKATLVKSAAYYQTAHVQKWADFYSSL